MTPAHEAPTLGVDAREGIFGPPGWTRTSGVADLLAPFLETWRGPGADFARFGGIGAHEALALAEALPSANLDDRQNDAPRVATLLGAAGHGGGAVELYGYLVSAPRWDERVSLDALVVPGAPASRSAGEAMTWGSARRALWDDLAMRFGLADGAHPPEELVWMPRGADDAPGWWLWWD